MRAGRVGFENEPAVDVTSQEIGIGDSSDASVEFEVTRRDISPVRIVLVILVELATDFDGVLASNQGKDIADVVNSLPRTASMLPLPPILTAQIHLSNPFPLINLNVGKYVGRRVGAISRFKPKRRGIILPQ